MRSTIRRGLGWGGLLERGDSDNRVRQYGECRKKCWAYDGKKGKMGAAGDRGTDGRVECARSGEGKWLYFDLWCAGWVGSLKARRCGRCVVEV